MNSRLGCVPEIKYINPQPDGESSVDSKISPDICSLQMGTLHKAQNICNGWKAIDYCTDKGKKNKRPPMIRSLYGKALFHQDAPEKQVLKSLLLSCIESVVDAFLEPKNNNFDLSVEHVQECVNNLSIDPEFKAILKKFFTHIVAIDLKQYITDDDMERIKYGTFRTYQIPDQFLYRLTPGVECPSLEEMSTGTVFLPYKQLEGIAKKLFSLLTIDINGGFNVEVKRKKDPNTFQESVDMTFSIENMIYAMIHKKLAFKNQQQQPETEFSVDGTSYSHLECQD